MSVQFEDLQLASVALSSRNVHDIRSSLTLRGIHDSLKHQRNECDEEKVIDEELRRAPERSGCALGDSIGASIFRRGGSRVSGSVARGGGGGGKASIEGVERVDASEPGKKGRHFIAGAWRKATIEVEGLGGIEIGECLLKSLRGGRGFANWPLGASLGNQSPPENITSIYNHLDGSIGLQIYATPMAFKRQWN